MDQKRGLAKGLGRGLGALIADQSQISDESSAERQVDINLLSPNRQQPRYLFEEEALIELAESIKVHGIIQPILVSKEKDAYKIIAGERRFRAAKIAGLTHVPVIVREKEEDAKTIQLALIENLQRENLNPMEESKSYKLLSETYGLNQEEIAKVVGKKRATIANAMRLLNLDPRVQNFIMEGRISSGHGKVLLGASDGDLRFDLAEMVIEEHLSVRDCERLLEKALSTKKEDELLTPVVKREAQHQTFESELKQLFGTKVHIKGKKKGGTIHIEYYSQDDLDRLMGLMKQNQ